MTDPTRTSWRLSSPAVWNRYSGAMVKTSAETNAAVAAMVRNTRSGRAMTASDRTTQGWRDQSRAVMAGDCTSECFVASECFVRGLPARSPPMRANPRMRDQRVASASMSGTRSAAVGMAAISAATRAAASLSRRRLEQVAHGGVDVRVVAMLRAEHRATPGVDDGQPVLPLVGEERDDELRPTVGRGAEHGAGPTVRDHGRHQREQPGLRHEALDAHVGRDRTERRRIDVRADRGDDVDGEPPEGGDDGPPTGTWWTAARSRPTRRRPAARRAPRPTAAGHLREPADVGRTIRVAPVSGPCPNDGGNGWT